MGLIQALGATLTTVLADQWREYYYCESLPENVLMRKGTKRTGGYCPCRLERIPENKCICEEFRNQIKDPEFEGYCHCMLYYKSLKDE